MYVLAFIFSPLVLSDCVSSLLEGKRIKDGWIIDQAKLPFFHVCMCACVCYVSGLLSCALFTFYFALLFPLSFSWKYSRSCINPWLDLNGLIDGVTMMMMMGLSLSLCLCLAGIRFPFFPFSLLFCFQAPSFCPCIIIAIICIVIIGLMAFTWAK